MTSLQAPQSTPEFDVIDGCLLSLLENRRVVLLTGELPAEFATYPLIVRYGFAYLYAENDFLVLTQVYDDYQRQHVGIEAAEFMLSKGERFPRADAIGYRLRDMAYREEFIRNIDIARSVFAFAFATPHLDQSPVQLQMTVWVTSQASGVEPVPDDERLQLSLLGLATDCYAANPSRVSQLDELF